MNPASAEMLIRASIHCMPIKIREQASFLKSCSLGGAGPDPSKVSPFIAVFVSKRGTGRSPSGASVWL